MSKGTAWNMRCVWLPDGGSVWNSRLLRIGVWKTVSRSPLPYRTMSDPVASCVKNLPGIYTLWIIAKKDPAEGTHGAKLKLKFDRGGLVYEKEIELCSTRIFHVDFE